MDIISFGHMYMYMHMSLVSYAIMGILTAS